MRQLVPLIAILLVACDSPVGVAVSELPLTRTVGDTFKFRSDAREGWVVLEVPFRFSNKTKRSLTLVHCHNDVPRLERATSDGWVRAFSGAELLCLMTRHFASGETVEDTARFYWRENEELEGEYRLAWANLWADFRDYDTQTNSWGTPVAEELLVSNTFTAMEDGR